MPLVYRYALPAVWLGWLVYWWAASRNVKSTVRREGWPSQLLHIVPFLMAAVLFCVPDVPIAFLRERVVPMTEWPFWLGLFVTGVGLLISVWARLHLGKNWSGTITIKKGHELVTSGPYAFVRHPIYSGLLLGFLGTALAIGDWRAVLAFALAAGALWRKLRVEERWMRQQFGDAYERYSRRVAALVPFVL
jgi:protein-S-isoprenylcysteine O-methyltransferase Ste14